MSELYPIHSRATGPSECDLYLIMHTQRAFKSKIL